MSDISRSKKLLIAAVVAVPVVIYCVKKYLNKNPSLPRSSFKNSFRSSFRIEDDTDGQATLDRRTASVSTGSWNALGLQQPLVIAMVGLPARGKSYITKMIIRYLTWTGFETEVFNVGSYRRKIGLVAAGASFFADGNKEGTKVREEMATSVQNMMYEWLHSGDRQRRVAIFDATNTTRSRRQTVATRAQHEGCFLLFVESICDDKEVLAVNYELKLQNDDYKGMDPQKAREDFFSRVQAYENVYETIEDDENGRQISYIKLINVGQKVISRNCTGYLPSQVGFYLQNVHIQPRKIYLSLVSETLGVLKNRYRNMSEESAGDLTEIGRRYSLDIARFMGIQMQRESEDALNNLSTSVSAPAEAEGLGRQLLVLAGTEEVHAETILHMRMLYPCYTTPLLNELRGGDFHGLSPDIIESRFPDEFSRRKVDKLHYRYPGVGGESYLDVIERLRPVVIELERQRRSVFVVSNVAVLRCIYAYFAGIKLPDIPYIHVDKHKLLELTPGPFGCQVRVIDPSSELPHM